MARLRSTVASVALLLGACASNPDPELIPDSPVRIAPVQGAVKHGDCVEARRRAAEKPDLEVDQLASPRAMTPPPLPVKEMPAAVRSARYSEVRVTVLVDTLGRADMRTFAVEKTTHPWLAASVKSAVARWRFNPAELAGCKVARVYRWGATAGKAPKGSGRA
ncbi:MAG: hypothetical protein JWL60_1368 [Gemmatimonadetes bacterium]|jgi:hypothetical protein|nr:hypothetical protein [Gemmatimonadota bacterium]